MAFSVAAEAYLASGDKAKANALYEELARLFKDKPEGRFAQQALKDTGLIGSAAPDLAGTAIDGSKISLKELAGKAVVVHFWATWNPECLDDLPNMRRLSKEMEGHPFAMIGVSLDRPGKLDELKKFAGSNDIRWPQLYEEKGWGSPIVKAFQVKQLPATYVIDGTGKIVRVGLHGVHLKDVVSGLANQLAK
jgi:peroxiredoxin